MKTIYKYPLTLSERQYIEVPVGAHFMCTQVQRGAICLWAMVNTDQQTVHYEIALVGTGTPMPHGLWQYIGTVQQGDFVWHIYYQ